MGSTPRRLALRHATTELEKLNVSILSNDSDGLPKLDEGEQQLFSSFQPRLQGGHYTITVQHDIEYPADPPDNRPDDPLSLPTKTNGQDFDVITPQFSLPANAINSVYPPQGYDAQITTLPHIVFNDPLLPWSRQGSSKPLQDKSQNAVPWLALLVFTADELTLPPEEVGGDKNLFRRTQLMRRPDQAVTDPVTQASSLAFDIRLDDLRLVDATDIAISKQDEDTEKSKIQAIFLKKALFQQLFREYPDGKAGDLSQQDRPDVTRYQYLSHVRRINTVGMAEAGSAKERFLSVVLSHRTAPLDLPRTIPITVHLVSIEDVEAMKEAGTWPISDATKYVALPSLYSWTYSCLPPNSFDVYHAMQHIGDSLGFLRASDDVIKSLRSQAAPQIDRVINKLQDGYTICRHSTQTGEVTAAIIRGALSPTAISSNISWSVMSSCGADLQILDPKIGLLDITYSTAWQLGKAQALADQSFCAAISRLRTIVHRFAMNQTKAGILRDLGAHASRDTVLEAIRDVIPRLGELHDADLSLPENHDPSHRWQRSDFESIDLSFANPDIVTGFSGNAPQATKRLAASLDGDGNQVYNELNTPYSTDWMIVLAWVMDKMYLHDIPVQYLLIDPSYLPKESLRFFFIDPNWIDAYIDGALSVANHMEYGDGDDPIRRAVKIALNAYLRTPIPKLEYNPQVPSYGFLLRSEIVARFPDLRVEIPPPVTELVSGAPILRQENIDKSTMLCLLEHIPSLGGFEKLRFTQPPHQQSFAVGAEIDSDMLVTDYKRIYSHTPKAGDLSQKLCEKSHWSRLKPVEKPVFDWEARTLLFPAWSEDVFSKLTINMPKDLSSDPPTLTFEEETATSAIVGIQLNSPVCELEMSLPAGDKEWMQLPRREPRRLNMVEPWIKPKSRPRRSLNEAEGPAVKRVKQTIPFSEESRSRPSQLSVASTSDTTLVAAPLLSPDIQYYRPPALRTPKKGVAGKLMFEFEVYTVDLLANESKFGSIPTNVDYKQNLIFSIRLVNPLAGEFHLIELSVTIPVGNDNTTSDAKLMDYYDGPGPSMLSNSRFNVLAEYDGLNMLLRLIPRRIPPEEHVKMISELGFMLKMVDVKTYTRPTSVNLMFMEKYKQDELRGTYLTTKTITLFQRPKRAD